MQLLDTKPATVSRELVIRGVPFGKENTERLKKAVNQANDLYKKTKVETIILGHIIPEDVDWFAKTGIKTNDFHKPGVNLAVLGDRHIPWRQGCVLLPGSPLPITFGEDAEHGIWAYDSHTGDAKFYDTGHILQMKTVPLAEYLEANKQSNIVYRVSVDKTELGKAAGLDVDIVCKPAEMETMVDIQTSDIMEAITAYASEVPLKGFTARQVAELGLSIYKKAQGEK